MQTAAQSLGVACFQDPDDRFLIPFVGLRGVFNDPGKRSRIYLLYSIVLYVQLVNVECNHTTNLILDDPVCGRNACKSHDIGSMDHTDIT